MLPKTSATMQNMCKVCNHAITLTFCSEDQNQVGISRENVIKQASLTAHLLLSTLNFSSFFTGKLGCKNQEKEQSSRVRRDELGLPAKGKL